MYDTFLQTGVPTLAIECAFLCLTVILFFDYSLILSSVHCIHVIYFLFRYILNACFVLTIAYDKHLDNELLSSSLLFCLVFRQVVLPELLK
jgi:hypothetical protein